MYKPPVIAADFEANSLQYWSEDFEVHSLALAWRREDGSLGTRYLEPGSIEDQLERIQSQGIPLLVHNLGYEYGVIAYKYPGCVGLDFIDSMRLAQMYDNGGGESPLRGFGLAKCVQRILGRPDPKERFYKELHLKGVKRGQEGENLALLGDDLYREYNIQDAVETLLLFEHIDEYCTENDINWRLDHSLYVHTTKRIAIAQGEGIAVDRSKLLQSRDSLKAEIDEIDVSFITRFKAEIRALEAIWGEGWVSALKTEKGRQKRRMALSEGKAPTAFNVGSKKHLEALFVDTLGLTPQFFTPTGRPSFKASHLPTYGSGGEMLAKRGKRMIVLKQVESLLALSEGDDRWHLSLKPTGTATGRLSGGRVDG